MSKEITAGGKFNFFKESHAPFKQYWQFLLANLALGILITLAFWSGPNPSLSTKLIATVWSFAVCYTQWSGNALLAGYLNEKISWIDQPLKRTVVGVIVTAGYSTLAYFIVQLLLKLIFFGEFPADIVAWCLDNIQTPLILSLSFTTVFIAVGFLNRWRESEVKANQLQAQMMTYKYEALRNQINPHFLFNSFNVLTDLVYEDQDLASKFIQQLSELYRYVLDSREKELVPLEEELEFIDSYLFLLKMRFDEKLKVELSLSPEAGQMLVPMSLQLLIENAVKHNEVSKAHPLQIKATQDGDWITVWNSLAIKNVGSDSKKTGLKNIKDQYALWTDKAIEVEQTATEFSVKIPVLRRVGK